MTDARTQLRVLFFTRFANAFGLITLLTLLGTYVNELGAEGLVLGMFATALTLAQGASVVPLTWLGDRYDKRRVLLAGLGLSVVVYAAFPLVNSSLGFIVVRMIQGIAATATGMIGLSLIGELASETSRGTTIGESNAWRFAAGIGGSLSAGTLYAFFGFGAVFAVLTAFSLGAFVVVWRYLEPDETTVRGLALTDLAVNRRILTITSFRAQYAVAVTLVRTWIPIFAVYAAASGGLGLDAVASGGVALGVVVAAEQFTNMLSQPYMGHLSDRFGRAPFVAIGGCCYGLLALAVPFTPAIGATLGLPASLPLLGDLSAGFLPLVALNALLGVADSIREPASMALFADEGVGNGITASFGVRDLVWRPGSILAPLLGGLLTTYVGIEWVFYAGALAAFMGVAAFTAVLTYDNGARGVLAW